MPLLALALAATAAAAQGLGPRILLVLGLLTGLAGVIFYRRARRQFGIRGLAIWMSVALGLLAVTGLRALPRTVQPQAQGSFESRWQGRGRELGTLQGHDLAVQLPAGFARDGDRLQVHVSAQQVLYAAPPGELPAPHSWAADPAQIRRTRSAPASFWKVPRPILDLRSTLARRLARLESEDNRGLAQALLLGRSETVDPGLKDRFTRTGTRHLLALSGLHVGLMWWMWVRPICQALAGLLSMRFAGRGLARNKQGLLATLLPNWVQFSSPSLDGGAE